MFKKKSHVQLYRCVHGLCAQCNKNHADRNSRLHCKFRFEIGIVSRSNRGETSYIVNGLLTSADNNFLREYRDRFIDHKERLKCSK